MGLPALHGFAADAPAEIKIGHLHAGSGTYASISVPVYSGLKVWIDQTNAEGGAFVKAFNKKIPLKLISYDDQSSTATAATLYNQLITQDKVDMLVADSGSVLTSVGVPIAKEHKQLLFDPTGTGAAFFKDNPYIALIADPVSTIWPKYIADFLKDDGVKAGLKRVALLYSTNEFTGTQANAVRGFLTTPGSGIEIVYDQGVPTNTSNYTVLINNITAAKPDAVIVLGYAGNDIAFLRNLQDSGDKFPFLFAIYPGIETEELLKNVGAQGLDGVFTYVTSAEIAYRPEVGMSADAFREAFQKANASTGVAYGFNAIAGYTVGVVLGQTLANADSLSQDDLRKAVFGLSGKLKTLDGTFELDEHGAQIGEITPLGQIHADGKDVKITVVYPHDLATGKPVIGK
jgi:branched-chain amino acid transport system substrate-binding protein